MNDETSSADATTRRLDTAALELLAANAKTVGVAAPAPGALNLERTGDWIGRYKLIEELGEGGFGVVWRAEQTEPIHREVALKVIRPGMDSREIIARFAAEQQALALMDHPNIAAVLDAGATDNGRPYFVMELVKGVPITTYCDEHKLTIRQRLELFIPVCQAVQHAHQKAILHRDLKPSNILVMEVDGKPVPKVIDFGIAKALGSSGELALQASLMRTQEGMVIGTPQYMSPEQAGSMPDVDTRSDIYTLGVILYELLTGNTPIPLDQLKQAALDQVLRLIREGDTKRPSSSLLPLSEAVKLRATDRSSDPKKISAILRGDIDWIVLKALEKERERRYDSANALAEDIQHHLQNEPVNAGPPSAAYRFRKLVQRNKLLVAASAAVLVCLLAGVAATGYALLLEQRARKQAVDNEARAQKMLREASRSDYATAHEHLGKSEWSKGVSYLGRSVRYDPANHMARGALWQTLMNGQSDAEKLPIHSLEHGNEVIAASFSPDGTRIVTSSRDKTARLWDMQTGKPIGDAMTHTGVVATAMFSPDGTRVVTGSHDKTARLWDAATGKPLGTVMAHAGYVGSAVFSPDGTCILTLNDDKTARLWDGRTGRPIGAPMLAWYKDSASFSPDGTRIVTSCEDQTVRLWNGKTSESLGIVGDNSGAITDVKFNPDGTRLVIASGHSIVRLWDVKSRKQVGAVMEHKGKVKLHFSADGSRIVTASDSGLAILWDAATGQSLGKPMVHPHAVSEIQFSPDGTRLLTVEGIAFEEASTARIWDSKTGEPIGNAMAHASSIDAAVFSPDGTRILTASSDKTARQWDAATGQPMGVPLMHEQWVIRATYNQDGSRILTASGDPFDSKHGSAKLWDAAIAQPIGAAIATDSMTWSVGFNVAGTHIVTGSRANIARIWNVKTGKPKGDAMTHSGPIVSASFSSDGSRVLTGSHDKTARLWDANSGHPIGKIMSHDGQVVSASFSDDGTRVLTASEDKSARIWNGKSGVFLGAPMMHAERVRCATFSPDGTHIVTAGDDKTARLWDANTGKPFGQVMKNQSVVTDACFSPDGTKLVTAGSNIANPLQLLWDAKTQMPVGVPIEIREIISSVRFSPDGKCVVTASGRYGSGAAGAARLWDAATGRPIGAIMPHKAAVEFACFSPDSILVATASGDGVRLWDGVSGQPFGTAVTEGCYRVAFGPGGKRLAGVGLLDRSTRLWEINTDQLLESAVAEDVAAFCSGLRLDAALGTLTRLSPAERMAVWGKIREVLSVPESSDWKFAVERHLPVSNPDALCSPRMTMTRHEMLESMILSRTPELVSEALAIEPGNPLLPYALAEIEDRADDKTGAAATRAQFLRHYGHKRLSAEIAKNPESAAGYVAMARSLRFALDLNRKDIFWSEVDKRQQHCIVLWQHLVEAMPEKNEWQMELAGSLHLAGQMQQTQNHFAKAEAYHLKALEIVERLKKSGQLSPQNSLGIGIQSSLEFTRKIEPAYRLHLAGQLQFSQGKNVEAEDSFSKALRIVESLPPQAQSPLVDDIWKYRELARKAQQKDSPDKKRP